MPLVASAQTKRTIHVATAGTLSDYISEDEKYQIEELTLSGLLNGTDFKFIRDMAGTISYVRSELSFVDYLSTDGILKSLDLSEVSIVGGGDGYITVPNYGGAPLDLVDEKNYDLYTIPNCISDRLFSYTKLSSIILPVSVTSIEHNAFESCRDLTSVTIPNSVTSIEGYSFWNCTNLTTIISEIQNPFAISDFAFDIGSYKDFYATATLVVPPGKKSAYQNTTGWNKFLKIVEVGGVGYTFEVDGIYYIIGENNTVYVTYGSTRYTGNIVIPSQVTFDGKLYTVTRIDHMAFSFASITSISIPSSISSMGVNAFEECSSLSAIYITDLEAWCKIKYASINEECPLRYAHHLYLNGTEIKDLVIPNTITSLNSHVFSGGSGFTSVTIPCSVTSIGLGAFSDCSGLTSLTLPNSVTSIGDCAFQNCSGLTSLTLPNSVTSIGWRTFSDCTGLTTIVSEIENPFSIEDNVFLFLFSDKDIYTTATLIVPPGKKSVYQNTAGWKKFQNIVEAELVGYEFEDNGIRYKIGENNAVTVVSRDAKYSGDVVIPSQVSYNGSNYDVTSIGSSAFEGCVDMTSVSIPGSVTTIGGAAFYYCTGLSTVDIPNGVTTIGEGAFSKCGDLASVTIPGSVTGIESNAFFQCYALTQITSWIENPFVINSNVFPTSVYSNAALNVPSGKKTVYQNTSGWKKFGNISESSKCAKPTISYSNGKISFSCETEGVEFHYTISNTNSSTGVGSWVNFSPTVNISVYASKSGFGNSDTSTAEIVVPAGLRGDLTGDGQVNVADHVELSKIILGQ